MEYKTRDTLLLSGWLFADLFLGLMIIFLSAVHGTVPQPQPPTLSVTPTQLNANEQPCTGGGTNLQCQLTIGETEKSQGNIQWSISSYMDSSVVFSQTSGTLSPGQSARVTISMIPCHNGIFTITGLPAYPIQVPWQCHQPQFQESLDFQAHSFTITENNWQGLLNNPPDAAVVNDIRQQVNAQPFLQGGHQVGFAIVADGAPTTTDVQQAQQVASAVYRIFQQMGQQNPAFQRAAYYDPLFHLNQSPPQIDVVVYLFKTQ